MCSENPQWFELFESQNTAPVTDTLIHKTTVGSNLDRYFKPLISLVNILNYVFCKPPAHMVDFGQIVTETPI